VADGAPSGSDATTVGIGTDLEFGIVWKNRTDSRCGSASQSHPEVLQSSQVVQQDVLTHLTTQCDKGVKRKQEQNSCEDLQDHVLRRCGLLTGTILFDQSQNMSHLLTQLSILLRRGCLSLGPPRKVLCDASDRGCLLTNLRQLHFVVGILLRNGQAVRQVIHKLLQARLLFALAIMGGTSRIFRRLSFGRTFLRRSPLDILQGSKLDRHPLVFGSLEKCRESSNAYQHGVDSDCVVGGLDCLLLLAGSQDCHGHLPHGSGSSCGTPRSCLVGQAAVGGSCHPRRDLVGTCDVGCLE
jgi:hypothetical protein